MRCPVNPYRAQAAQLEQKRLILRNNRLRIWLDQLYNHYARRKFVSPDPLELLYAYPSAADREIAGLVAACLAYGKVDQIVKNARWVLKQMAPSPLIYIKQRQEKDIYNDFKNFKYRFATGTHMADLCIGVQRTIKRFGSLNNCFVIAMDRENDPVHVLNRFAEELTQNRLLCPGHLVPQPDKGSACKRLLLYLRWMVRKDPVDPGGWVGVGCEKLIVPLDTHMFKMGIRLGFTRRGQANMRTALEITRGFQQISPNDPVRYDFALTRLGIRKSMDNETLPEHLARIPDHFHRP